jgi:hypothetical protein
MSCPYSCNDEKKKIEKNGTTCLLASDYSYGPIDPVAVACTLYPCLEYYSATVDNARLNEEVVRQTPLQLQGPNSFRENYIAWQNFSLAPSNVTLGVVQQPCLVDGVLYTQRNMSSSSRLGSNATLRINTPSDRRPSQHGDESTNYENITAPLECVAEMSRDFRMSLIYELQFALGSNCTLMEAGIVQCKVAHADIEALHPTGDIPTHPAHLAALFRNGTASVETISQALDSLATRLTTEIRIAGQRLGTGEEAKVRGEVLESRICVRFAWKWLVFPGILLALVTILLLFIVLRDIMVTRSTTWKSSVLPLLLKDHPGMGRRGLTELEATAKGLELMLQREKAPLERLHHES